MNTNARLQEIQSRLDKVNQRGIKTPKTLKIQMYDLNDVMSFQPTEFTRIQTDKLFTRIEENLDVLEGKESPKGRKVILGETLLSTESIQRKAKSYRHHTFMLSLMIREFENRKAELLDKIANIEAKIPMGQLSEWRDILTSLPQDVDTVSTDDEVESAD